MDRALFTVLQKIDLMVVPATLKLRSPISCIYAQLILISMHQNTIWIWTFKNAPSPAFPTTTTLVQRFSGSVWFELWFAISKHSTEPGLNHPLNHTWTEPWFGPIWFGLWFSSRFKLVQIWTTALSRSTLEGFRVQEGAVGYLGRVSIWRCRGLNVRRWHSDCHGLKDASSDLERRGAIIDFQTGGPIMSTLLLIYMYWKSNGFYQGKPFRPAIGPLRVDIQSHPYDVIGSDTGPTQVCGGWWVTGVTVPPL